jgi:hypothetical protein
MSPLVAELPRSRAKPPILAPISLRKTRPLERRARQWSVKAEYLYYDLGSATWSLGNINQFGLLGTLLETVSTSQSSTRFNGNIVRAGINWHF